MKRPVPFSHGLTLARGRLLAMPDDELAALTPDRLIASYGLRPSEADHLIRQFQRRV